MQRLSLLALASLCLCSCEQEDPTTSAYWIKRLQGTERRTAIQKLGEMKAKDAVVPLQEAYKAGHLKFQILAALTQIGDKAAVPTMIAALKDKTEPKAAQIAGNTLLEWEVADHTQDYINVASDAGASNEARLGALSLLAKYPKPEAAAALMPVLAADPDVQPIVLAGLAAEALGKLRHTAAVPQLVLCMWRQDATGRHAVPPCRLALARIGGKTVLDEVVKTLERKNRALEKYARRHKFDKGGLVEAKCAELLGDLAHPGSVDALMAALGNKAVMPPSVQQDPRKAQAFAMASTQKTISIANALATIGDPKATKALVEVAATKERILQERIAAIQQLAFLGDESAAKDLLKMLGNMPHERDPNAQGLQIEMALTLANLLDGTDAKTMKALNKEIDKITAFFDKHAKETQAKVDAANKAAKEHQAKGDAKAAKSSGQEARAWDHWVKIYQERHRRYGKVKAKVAAVEECKKDIACWEKKLGGKDDAIQLTAAYRIAQTKSDASKAILSKHVGHDDLTLRNVILFGIERQGDASVVPALEAARDADQKRTGKKAKMYKASKFSFDVLIAGLKAAKG